MCFNGTDVQFAEESQHVTDRKIFSGKADFGRKIEAKRND